MSAIFHQDIDSNEKAVVGDRGFEYGGSVGGEQTVCLADGALVIATRGGNLDAVWKIAFRELPDLKTTVRKRKQKRIIQLFVSVDLRLSGIKKLRWAFESKLET